MGKIGDLFVKLGLKNDEYKKGIEQSKRDTRNFGESVKKMGTAAKAVWAAVGVAVVKFAKDFIGSTQKLGDQWKIAMEGMKAGYGAFIRGISSGEGWTELFTNIREAVRLSREAAASLDEVFERKVSYGYKAAETEREIANLQLIMRDASKSDDERVEAAKKIIELEKQLGEIKKDVAQQEADARRQLFQAQTQLNNEETDFLLKNYNANRDSIKQAREYYEERKRLVEEVQKAEKAAELGHGRIGADQLDKNADAARQNLQNLDNATSESIKHIAELTKKYDKGNDELIKGMAEAEIAVINVDTEVARASSRATAMLGTLTKASGVSAGGSTTDTGLTNAQKIQRRAEDSAKSELQLLSEKYNEEKALLEKYHLDTTALTKEYHTNLFNILNKGLDDEIAKILEIDPVELEIIDTSDVDAMMDELLQQMIDATERAQEIAKDFSNAISGGFADACDELMQQLMGLEEFNVGAVVQALLTPLCDLAEKAGAIIMAEGLATIAAKSALETFGVTGWGAVAAGAALMAAGAAAKAGLSALASSGTTTTSTYTGNSSSTQQTQNIESELTVYVKGTLKGSDIVLASERTQTSWSR